VGDEAVEHRVHPAVEVEPDHVFQLLPAAEQPAPLMSMIASPAGGEACVCDLTPAFALSGPTISHHLRPCAKLASSPPNAAAPGSTTAHDPAWSYQIVEGVGGGA